MAKRQQDDTTPQEFFAVWQSEDDRPLKELIADAWDNPPDALVIGTEHLVDELFRGAEEGFLTEEDENKIREVPLSFSFSYGIMVKRVRRLLDTIPFVRGHYRKNPERVSGLAEKYAENICKYRALKIVEDVVTPYLKRQHGRGRPKESPLHYRFIWKMVSDSMREHWAMGIYPVSIATGKPIATEKAASDNLREYLLLTALVLLSEGLVGSDCKDKDCTECLKSYVKSCEERMDRPCDFRCKLCVSENKKFKITEKPFTACSKADKVADILNRYAYYVTGQYQSMAEAWIKHNRVFIMDSDLRPAIRSWCKETGAYHPNGLTRALEGKEIKALNEVELRETEYTCPTCGNKLYRYRFNYHVCRKCNSATRSPQE